LRRSNRWVLVARAPWRLRSYIENRSRRAIAIGPIEIVDNFFSYEIFSRNCPPASEIRAASDKDS
jgi:hypothetical protein